jgi:peptidoglycan hydrolase CwlO-like protein
MKKLLFFLCISFFLVASSGVAPLHAESEDELKLQLKSLEDEISGLQQNITEARSKGTGLQSDIKLLEKKIAESQLKIKSTQATIAKLNSNITEKDRALEEIDAKLARENDSLGQILRKMNYISAYTLLDYSLQEKTLSGFFSDRDSYGTLEKALQHSFDDISTSKEKIADVKSELEDAKDEEIARRIVQEAEKKRVESNQKEKANLLTETKGKEAEYKKVLAARQVEAAKVRAKIFALRDSSSISFGQAYDYAVLASKATGVRPALILAILTQESQLGKDIGACYISDYNTGNGVSIRTGDTKIRVMNPSRDIPVFLSITQTLGRDPNKTPVSCWIPLYSRGTPYGWGGAMGPSQFIPSTWKLLANRIQNAVGAPADPWLPYHAITATALYLSDLGAMQGNETSERTAACKYYSGSSCSKSSDGAGYGNSVMKRVYSIQADIDTLQKS